MHAPSDSDALRDGAAVVRSDRDILRLSGADVVPFLQTKLTCDTRRWSASGYGYGFATDINGRVVFDAHFVLDDAGVLASLEPGRSAAAREHLERYVILEDVTISVPEPAPVSLGCTGAVAAAALAEVLGVELPEVGHALRLAEGTSLFAFDHGGGVEVHVLAPASSIEGYIAALAQRGIPCVDPAAWDRERLRRGVARPGVDIVYGETIPLEAGAWHGVSLNKGCYLGQEIIERLYSRGSPARRLCRVAGDGAPPEPGTGLLADERDAGEITGAVTDAAGWIGLARVRRRALDDDLPMTLATDARPVRRLALLGGDGPA